MKGIMEDRSTSSKKDEGEDSPKFDGNGDANKDKIARISYLYVSDSKQSCFERWNLNRRNYDTYHLKQDYSHKREGQSREILGKTSMSVEQITQFFQQGLLDLEDWFKVEYALGVDPTQVKITKEEIRRLVDRQLKATDFFTKVGDAIKTGLLGSLCIFKVGGHYKKKPFYKVEEGYDSDSGKVVKKLKRGNEEIWELNVENVMPENFYMDPTGRKLYAMNQLYLDWFEVEKLSKGPNAIYDPEILAKMPRDYAMDYENRLDDMRRTGTRYPDATVYRKQVKIQEFWGSIIDRESGEVLYENVVWTIADDRYLLQPPTPNPYWHGHNPYVVSPLIRVPGSELHRALMDAPTAHNIAINELYNLAVDAGMMSTYGIKQFRPDWIEDDAAFSEGFYPGQNVAANSSCPPGGKVVERVDTSSMSQETMAVMNMMQQEYNQSALTNDLRMGMIPNKQVKATEVVEANQTINSVFAGIAKQVECMLIEVVVDRAWKTTLQHMNDLSEPDVISLLGKERAMVIKQMSPEDRFAEVVNTAKFSVWGVSRNLTKQKDARKLTALLQTITANPQLQQEFNQKYSMTRLLDDIMRSMDINVDLLTMSDQEKKAAQQRQMQMMQMQAQLQGGGQQNQGAGQPGTGPNAQSQIPQGMGQRGGSMNQTVESHVGQAQGGMHRAAQEAGSQ